MTILQFKIKGARYALESYIDNSWLTLKKWKLIDGGVNSTGFYFSFCKICLLFCYDIYYKTWLD